MKVNKSRVKKILVINLSNIGDAVLTTPVIQALRRDFPHARLAVLVGPRAFSVFKSDTRIDRKIIYDKAISWKNKLGLVNRLRYDKYDMVVDLRHSAFGLFLGTRYRTSIFAKAPKSLTHMKDKHLWKLKSLGLNIDGLNSPTVVFSEDDQIYVEQLFNKWQIKDGQLLVAIAPGARNMTKRWEKEGYRKLIERLDCEYNASIIMVGDKQDELLVGEIISQIKPRLFNATGITTIGQLASLLNRCKLLISNDSAPMHLAWAVNTPVIAIFGPTDYKKYAPCGPDDIVIRKNLSCSPCEQSLCPKGTRECIKLITVDEVFTACKKILNRVTSDRRESRAKARENQKLKLKEDNFKRILISRTDRIGDLLLSTPAIKALRKNFPKSYIAVMIRPYARDIVLGNPYLDEVIIYDKYGAQGSLWSTIRFAWKLRRKGFDLALILHPTNRAHLVTFLAGIKKRVGFNKKLGFLLTDKIKHKKQKGRKHELEYTLDIVRFLDIDSEDKDIFMPIRKDSEMYIEEFLSGQDVKKGDRLVALHPGASCPSKIWPKERFARVADKIAEEFKARIVVVAGSDDVDIAKGLLKLLHCPYIDATGKTTVSQLASLLRRCCLFISNDSGPVHIASAVGVSVVAIFGRSQPGLSPRRWGPRGEGDIVLHKDVGCSECLAHNCQKGFACLKAISAQEVLEAARELLSYSWYRKV